MLRPVGLGDGIGYPFCVSPRSSDCIISADLGVRRAVSEGSGLVARPSLLIACTHHIVTGSFIIPLPVVWDTQVFQHIAGF
jgi:hypothetical protein